MRSSSQQKARGERQGGRVAMRRNGAGRRLHSFSTLSNESRSRIAAVSSPAYMQVPCNLFPCEWKCSISSENGGWLATEELGTPPGSKHMRTPEPLLAHPDVEDVESQSCRSGTSMGCISMITASHMWGVKFKVVGMAEKYQATAIAPSQCGPPRNIDQRVGYPQVGLDHARLRLAQPCTLGRRPLVSQGLRHFVRVASRQDSSLASPCKTCFSQPSSGWRGQSSGNHWALRVAMSSASSMCPKLVQSSTCLCHCSFSVVCISVGLPCEGWIVGKSCLAPQEHPAQCTARCGGGSIVQRRRWVGERRSCGAYASRIRRALGWLGGG